MMKKLGNIIVDKFTSIVDSRHNKRIAAAAVAVLLTAAVVTTSVFNRTSQAAENADTLMGIEKLRNQFSEGEEYTVLEIVPDISAAEIGYLFDGYEPILSEWDEETMTWKSWKDVLCAMSQKEDRIAYMEGDGTPENPGKKAKLKAYYASQGFKDNESVPVTISDERYDDSEEYQEGYEEVTSNSYESNGYFTSDKLNMGDFYVSFKPEKQEGAVYYDVSVAIEINSKAIAESIVGGTYIYTKDGSYYTCVGNWASIGETVMNGISVPESNQEEVDDDNDDGDKDDNTGDGNESESGTGDDGDENSSDNDENEGGSENDNGENEDNNANDDAGNGSGSDIGDNGNESGNNNSDNNKESGNTDAAGTQSGTGVSLESSVSKVRWLKFISSDASSDVEGASKPENNSSEDKQNNSSDDGVSSNPDNNQGGEASGSDNEQGGETSGSDNEQGGEASGSDNEQGGETSGSDNEQGGETSASDNEQGGETSGSDNEQGGGTGDSDNNQGDNDSDNNQDEDGTDDNEDGNKDDNTDDDFDKKPDDEDKESDKDLDKKPDKGNVTTQDVSKAQSEKYYLVYFDRVDGGEYIVDQIRPAKYGKYGDEPEEHPTGQYSFDKSEGDNTQTYTFPGRVLYCKGIFHNNEWFKQYVLNMGSDNFENFKVKVITLTPAELNNIYENGTKDYEKGTVPDFDFLYLNSGLRTSEIDIINSSDEDGNNDKNPNQPDTGAENNPDKNEVGDDTDKTGDDDKTGDNGDADKPGESDQPGDSGDADKPGDSDQPGDSGDADKPGEGDQPGDSSDADKSGEADNAVDNGNTEDNGDADNSADEDKTANKGGSENDGDMTSTGNSSKSGDSDNNNNSDNNINNSSYSGKSSLWKAFVSKDDSDEDTADNKAKTGSTEAETGSAEASDRTVDTGNNENTDSTGNTDNSTDNKDDSISVTDNKDDNTGDADNKDDNTGDADSTDDSDNKGSADDTDADNAGEAAEPDKAEESSDNGESDKKESSSGSDDYTVNKTDASTKILYSTANDVDKDVANLLFKKVSEGPLSCLVDGSILYDKAEDSGHITVADTENTQVFRLAAMLCQEDLEKDYTSVNNDNLLKGIVDGDKNFTTEQVYCRLGNGSDSVINGNFFQFTIYKEGGEVEEGFRNVLDEIKLENLFRESDTSGHYEPLPTNISQAEAVRHILNYPYRRNVEPKESIKVLEIQPAYTTEPTLTEKQIRKWAPGVKKVETTIMTTAEFIGKIDKLNEIYDLIYIGTSKEHLNISNWVTDKGKSEDGKYLGSTVFNDEEMNGLIYYNVGDKRVVNLPMSGLLESEYKNGRTYYYNFARYSGNDITKEKEEALISFLDGSYPIVVSDDFIEQPVTVFESDNYTGRRATLNVGEYNEQALLDNQIFAGSATPEKGISSIQVKKGYQITLFEEPDCTGEFITLTEDVNSFTTSSARLAAGQTWNNRCRSAIVEEVEDVESVRALDDNHIDNSSYLYNFASTALKKKYNNFFAEGDLDKNTSELFKFYLNRPKASLVDFSTGGLKGNVWNGSEGVNDVYYIRPNTIGRYTLQYNFTIKNEGAASMDTRYNCKLYIDVNADGKFSEFEEVADIVITNKQSGGIVSSNELYAGVPYTIIREVPSGYKGLLPWKVEVCQVNNDNIYASEKGYTKLSEMDKETLKICQINKNTDNKWRVIDLSYEIENKGRYFNTLVHGGIGEDGVNYEGIDEDFELDVETINISKFESYYNPSSPDYNPDYLNDFNMLILGFSDAYDDFSGIDTDPNTPLGAVIEFINSGKSVLMGHDNTSYWNNPDTDGVPLGYTKRNDTNSLEGLTKNSRFAANINKYIRPLVGMDRYGVLSTPVVKRGVALKEGAAGWSELFTSGKEVAYKPKSARKETVPEAQGFTNVIISVRDTDSKDAEKRDYSKYNLYSGGYSNLSDFSNTYVSQRFDDCYYDNDTKDNGEINSANTSGKVKNVHVTQVNQGQITEYPYKLKDDFEVAQTHAQYYQLDYTADDDGDGQSDLVVWYCLGGRTADPKTPEKQTTIYSQSPNDVRNNYYIYNKGNITYTGMGHGANDNSNKNDNKAGYTFEEAKLFINTIIASYQAGVKPPTVTVLDSGSPDASQLTTMYRYYDSQHDISITDLANKEEHFEKVYFTVRDLNFVKGTREIETHAYYHSEKTEGSGTTITVGGEEISVKRLEDLIYDPETDNLVDAYHLTSGKIYYILVPKDDVLSDCEKGLDIYFEAQSTVKTNTTTENVYTTDKVYAKLQVLRAYLFELD